MEAVKQEIFYTTEFIENLSNGQRAELIDGQIYYMAPPTYRHQELLFELSLTIGNYIKSKKEHCKVALSPFAVFLNENDKTYVEPDISIICDKSKLTKHSCVGSPDWIIEIVSPSSRQMDYFTKLFKYRSADVREYWIVDPLKNRIMVYQFESSTITEYSFSDSIKVGIYEDLTIDFSELPNILDS